MTLRLQGINPRARGTNPRAKGTNPKAIGTNPKAGDTYAIRIDAPHFCAGAVCYRASNKVSVQTAPILKWTRGKAVQDVIAYARRKGWKVDIIDLPLPDKRQAVAPTRRAPNQTAPTPRGTAEPSP